MAAGLAHLLALPHKMPLSREEYLTVQQLYGGWALLGIAVVGALLSSAAWTVLVRGRRLPFALTLAATLCIALSLAVFFAVTFPANQVTRNWTVLPDHWELLRRRWEYSHAIGAVLYVVAFVAQLLAVLQDRR